MANLSNNLLNNTKSGLFTNIKSENLSTLLSADTLYVPKSIIDAYDIFAGKGQDRDDYFAKYRYKYKICSDNELYEIFETQQRGSLLFEYVQSATDKFITIYDLKEKTIIYKKYSPLKYSLRSSDLEKIE